MKSDITMISKVLSPNDVGETLAHQAGILVPKSEGILDFFPDLGNTTKNPRCVLHFTDEFGSDWKLTFIYYNNKFFGGTRNEYRLTGLTRFYRESGLESGDTLILHRTEDGDYRISYKRSSKANVIISTDKEGKTIKKLIVSDSWKIIDY